MQHHPVQLNASVDMSPSSGDAEQAQTLNGNAHSSTVQRSRNGVQRHRTDRSVLLEGHQPLDQDLRGALNRTEFTLYYQRKVELKTGATIGAEALSRWMHPTRGLIAPSEFIPAAEMSGMIVPIGLWVLREACAQARNWRDSGFLTRSVTVNVSALQLECADFLDQLLAILALTGLDPEALELDLPEWVLMNDPKRATNVLRSIRDKGVKVSVDHFGLDWSSISMLRKLPLDALKIDRALIRSVAQSPHQRSRVKAILDTGRRLNLRVIAGGVETSEDLEFLWDYGCEQAQGYYFGRAMPPRQWNLQTRVS